MRNFLSILLFGVLISSCQQQALNEQNLTGKWRITDYTASVSLSPSILEAAKKAAITTVYTFNSNKTFDYIDQYSPNGKSGLWKLNTDPDKIEMKYDDDSTAKWIVFEITSFNGTEMTWKHEMGMLGSETITLEKDEK